MEAYDDRMVELYNKFGRKPSTVSDPGEINTADTHYAWFTRHFVRRT